MTLAVAAGFVAMYVLVIATQVAMLRYLFHTGAGMEIGVMPPAYYLANAAVRWVYAVIAGCITAAIGKKYEAPTVLGALLLGTAIGSVVTNRSGEPLWYVVLVGVAAAVLAIVAGYRWLGRLPDTMPEEKPR